ncbi:hypothetical protein F5Y08DRAFT_332783 [Xylaria arbuscula]|nr:hypothetical protein F5Y08DRAFT_332783 [Xylaria arbuscula]
MGRFQGRYAEVQDQSSENLEARYEAEDFGHHSQYHYAPNPQEFRADYDNKTAPTNSRQQYKPTALRWPFLITLLLALLTTLAFLSYAVTSLPVVGTNDIAEHLEARGLYVVKIREDAQSTTTDLSQTTPSGSDDEQPTETPEQTRGSDDYGNIGTQTVTVEPTFSPTPVPSDFGDIGTKTITVADSSTTIPAGDSDGSSSDSIPVASSKAQSDFGKIGTVTVSEDPGTTSETPTVFTTKAQISEEPGDASETPISTYFSQDQSDFGKIGTKTVMEVTSTGAARPSDFGPDSSADIETKGSVIATSTETPPSITSLETSTLTNSEGDVTATQVVTVMVAPSLTVETDSAGNPTATVATISASHYFMGTFLTTLVASILAIAVRILDTNAKSFQPWHALTHEQGSSGRDSICLDTGGWRSLLMVVFLVSLLSLSSAVLIPVSAGAITLDLRGDGCKIGGSTASNCAYVLSVSPMVSKATIGILAVMIGRWRLGVYTNPWSMSTLASLSVNPEVRRMILDAATGPDTKRTGSDLRHQDFKLDYFRGVKGQMEYGIVALDRFRGTGLSMYQNENSPLTSGIKDEELLDRRNSSPFFMLGIVGRICLFLFMSGVLVLVLYYARTGGDTPFERFIDSDSFGVQFLFTGLGVVITLLWSGFFGAVSIMNSYQYLSEGPREAAKSVLLAPPSNAFSGLWHAIRTRRVFLGLVSLASILSESLGIFLGNVRFQVTQTFFVNQLCTWAAVAIISMMLLVLLISFFLKWPHMPVDPSSIAGAMYYVCDNSVIDKFEGLSTFDKTDRDRTVSGMDLLYEFGERMSAEGGNRAGLIVLDTKVFMP